MAFYDHNGRDIGEALDCWITGNFGNDDPANHEEEAEPLTLEDRADLARDRAEEKGEY